MADGIMATITPDVGLIIPTPGRNYKATSPIPSVSLHAVVSMAVCLGGDYGQLWRVRGLGRAPGSVLADVVDRGDWEKIAVVVKPSGREEDSIVMVAGCVEIREMTMFHGDSPLARLSDVEDLRYMNLGLDLQLSLHISFSMEELNLELDPTTIYPIERGWRMSHEGEKKTLNDFKAMVRCSLDYDVMGGDETPPFPKNINERRLLEAVGFDDPRLLAKAPRKRRAIG